MKDPKHMKRKVMAMFHGSTDRVPAHDQDVLADIASGNVVEAKIYQTVIRLIAENADLRRRLNKEIN